MAGASTSSVVADMIKIESILVGRLQKTKHPGFDFRDQLNFLKRAKIRNFSQFTESSVPHIKIARN